MQINKSEIISLIKNKRKSASSSDNYRGISLNTIISKLFDIIILNKIKKSLPSSDCQFGFREGHSTMLCASVMSQTIQYYINENSKLKN